MSKGHDLSSLRQIEEVIIIIVQFSVFQIEDESEVAEAEKEMDEVDDALHQGRRKHDVRRKHRNNGFGSRLTKMLSKYKTKLDFRCNGMCSVH